MPDAVSALPRIPNGLPTNEPNCPCLQPNRQRQTILVLGSNQKKPRRGILTQGTSPGERQKEPWMQRTGLEGSHQHIKAFHATMSHVAGHAPPTFDIMMTIVRPIDNDIEAETQCGVENCGRSVRRLDGGWEFFCMGAETPGRDGTPYLSRSPKVNTPICRLPLRTLLK